jgi:hypothetical protein
VFGMRFFRQIFASIVMSFVVLGVANSKPINGGENDASLEKLVASIYKEYAWTVLFGVETRLDSAIPLSQEPQAKLKKIFTDDLAIAISTDERCAKKTRGICLLDFDILFASQDPAARDLSIKSIKEHTVEVCFIEQSDSRRCVEFVGVKEAKGVRIRDIKYKNIGSSLRAILKLK